MEQELIALASSTGVLALLSAALGLGFRKRGKERETALEGWTDENVAGMEREQKLHETMAAAAAKHLNELATVIADNKAQWDQREAEHRAVCADKDVQAATLSGRLHEARQKAQKWDMLVQSHSFHRAGKALAHGKEYELWECDAQDPTANMRLLWPLEGVPFRETASTERTA